MDAKQKLKNGWIHVLVTLEVVGKPKEHVADALKQLIERIKEEKDRVEILEHHIEEVVEHEDGFCSSFAEIDCLVNNIEALTWLAANYTPASIEVIEPSKFSFNAGDLQRWYTNILEVMHSIGYAHKMQQSEMIHLKGQLRALIENILLLSLARSPKTIPQLKKDTSIDEKAIEAHLGSLEKAERIVKKGDVWSLA